MAGWLQLSPVPSWLVLLLVLTGEPVPAAEVSKWLQDPAAKDQLLQNSAGTACSRIRQRPRFMAKKRGSDVAIECLAEKQGIITWLWKQTADQEPRPVQLEKGRIAQSVNNTLTIHGIQSQDSGIYICQQECPQSQRQHGCGTELRVMGFSTLEQLKRRNTLKDGIIMIQTLLIILFIVVPVFLLLDKDDSKSGMEEDHTYEGLDIDQTATYEDIVTLRTGEVKWSVGEHPSRE